MVSLHPDVQTLRLAFQVLCRLQRRWSHPQPMHPELMPSSQALDTWQSLNNHWFPIREEELEEAFSGNNQIVSFGYLRRVLYLPPLLSRHNTDLVPVMSLECDLTNANTLKLRLMFVKKDKEEGFVGIGLRMDKGEGEHGYYHAQFISALQSSNETAEHFKCPCWLPQTQPSIPICADSAITLLLCALLSVYGLEDFYRLVPEFNRIPRFSSCLREFRRRLGLNG